MLYCRQATYKCVRVYIHTYTYIHINLDIVLQASQVLTVLQVYRDLMGLHAWINAYIHTYIHISLDVVLQASQVLTVLQVYRDLMALQESQVRHMCMCVYVCVCICMYVCMYASLLCACIKCSRWKPGETFVYMCMCVCVQGRQVKVFQHICVHIFTFIMYIYAHDCTCKWLLTNDYFMFKQDVWAPEAHSAAYIHMIAHAKDY
jgi:hypothetical protein